MAEKKTNYFLVGIAIIAVVGITFFIFSSGKENITGNIIDTNKVSNQQQDTVTCNSPYIKVGISCCLDQNSNNICDSDETIKQESSDNVWKELYEEACYGKDNLISKSQAENIAKHYAVIQTNNNAKNPISTGDIKTKFPTGTIGEKCNPDWFVSLELEYMDKYDDQETSRYFITVSGEMVNATLQGASFLPSDYVLKKVEASINYHTKSSSMPFVGGSETHSSPFANVP